MGAIADLRKAVALAVREHPDWTVREIADHVAPGQHPLDPVLARDRALLYAKRLQRKEHRWEL